MMRCQSFSFVFVFVEKPFRRHRDPFSVIENWVQSNKFPVYFLNNEVIQFYGPLEATCVPSR